VLIRSVLAKAWFILFFASTSAIAGPIGEMHRTAVDPTASLRDAEHRDQLRITIWYPAATGAKEQALLIGPPGKALFNVGSIAPQAAFASGVDRHSVLLLSHGFGGTARVMGWFGTAMAREGYIVVAVDHPGNNAIDKMTVAGAVLWWDRAEDLRIALDTIKHDPTIGPHLDLSRLGVAGFSAGGFTALVASDARVDVARFIHFCQVNPEDSVCGPQEEFVVTKQDAIDLFKRPEIAVEATHAGDDHAIPQIRATFVIAPALVQALDPASLAHMHVPVEIMLGDADHVALPATNGLIAAKMIPGAILKQLPDVGHDDFLATCTDLGRATLPGCKTKVPQDNTHQQAIQAATTFFDRQLSVTN
jgi:predicted dienelactone hydrolase